MSAFLRKRSIFPPYPKVCGFTLVEMLVSLGIFALITTIALTNHGRFNNTILLTNLAYETALTIRQAQAYGLGVRGAESGANRFDVGYGVHFITSSPASFVFFVDKGGATANRRYDSAGGELIEVYTLLRGHTIKRFCGLQGGTERCSDSTFNPIDSINIVFERPDPDAIITSSAGTLFSRARIVVAGPTGTEREVVVESTGQISVP